MSQMQETFFSSNDLVNRFTITLSAPRISRYLTEVSGDNVAAVKLYHWNVLLSQSLYLPVQAWEVCLRNQLNEFLSWKFNDLWPYEPRALRAFRSRDQAKVLEAIKRQERQRKTATVPTSAIVADLSAGFWVSMLTRGYDVPFVWRRNLSRIFPNAANRDREATWNACNGLLDLRNRIAHHEPIYRLDLPKLRVSLGTLVESMCPGTKSYLDATCTFDSIWAARP